MITHDTGSWHKDNYDRLLFAVPNPDPVDEHHMWPWRDVIPWPVSSDGQIHYDVERGIKWGRG